MRYFIFIFNFIICQEINTVISSNVKLKFEIESIKNNIEKEELFLLPLINTINNKKKINFLKNYSNNISIEPVLALRYSNASFEIDPINTPSPVVWITPGLHLNGRIPIFYNFTSTWIYFWADSTRLCFSIGSAIDACFIQK